MVTGHLRVPASSKSWSSAGLVRAAVRGRSGRYTRWDPHKLKKSTGLLEPSTDKVTMSVSLKNTNQISRLKYLCFHMTMHKRHIWRPNSVQWCIFVIARVTYVQHSWRWKLEERAPFYFSSNPRALLMLLSLNVSYQEVATAVVVHGGGRSSSRRPPLPTERDSSISNARGERRSKKEHVLQASNVMNVERKWTSYYKNTSSPPRHWCLHNVSLCIVMWSKS